MWHELKKVADSRLLDAELFEAFVKRVHSDKLDDLGMISNWDVNEVVTSYRNSMSPTVLEQHRQQILRQHMKDRQAS